MSNQVAAQSWVDWRASAVAALQWLHFWQPLCPASSNLRNSWLPIWLALDMSDSSGFPTMSPSKGALKNIDSCCNEAYFCVRTHHVAVAACAFAQAKEIVYSRLSAVDQRVSLPRRDHRLGVKPNGMIEADQTLHAGRQNTVIHQVAAQAWPLVEVGQCITMRSASGSGLL